MYQKIGRVEPCRQVLQQHRNYRYPPCHVNQTMVIFERSVRYRERLHAGDCDNWPSLSHSAKYCLWISEEQSTHEKRVKALRLAKERPDIDEVDTEVQTLIDPQLRKEWSELLDIDRSWNIYLSCSNIPKSLTIYQSRNNARVRDSLAVLRRVKYFVLERSSLLRVAHIDNYIWILRNLPTFEKLECINLNDAMVDRRALEELMGLSVAPKLTGIQFCEPLRRLRQPFFSRKVTKQLRAFHIEFPGSSKSLTLDLIDALLDLPALQKLDVEFHNFFESDSSEDDFLSNYVEEEVLSEFFDCLKRPNCSIQELLIRAHSNWDLTPQMVFPHLSQVPKLQTLHLTLFPSISFGIEELLQFLRDSRTIEFVYLQSCPVRKQSRKDLLEFQLQCRPRLITIGLSFYDCRSSFGDEENELEIAADEEGFDQVALLFRRLRAYRKSLVSNPIPHSAWPVFLEKLGKTAGYTESLAIQAAGIDAIYGVLPDMLHCMNWSPGKKRKRKG